jgi:hypothetical protein
MPERSTREVELMLATTAAVKLSEAQRLELVAVLAMLLQAAVANDDE